MRLGNALTFLHPVPQEFCCQCVVLRFSSPAGVSVPSSFSSSVQNCLLVFVQYLDVCRRTLLLFLSGLTQFHFACFSFIYLFLFRYCTIFFFSRTAVSFSDYWLEYRNRFCGYTGKCLGKCMQSLGRDSSVGIATRYGLDGPRIESRWGEIFRTCPDQP